MGERARLNGAPALQTVAVNVMNKHANPVQPVQGARVTLWFFDGSRKITEAQQRTNAKGQTELRVPTDVLEQGNLRVEVSDAPGLVMYSPGEGMLAAIPRDLPIALVPKGSPELLEPAQIEVMLNRLSGLTIQVRQLKTTVDSLENEKPDFEIALRGWASDNGLPFNEVDTKVKAWSQDVLDHRDQASLEKQAEAELGLGRYEAADALYRRALAIVKKARSKEQDNYLAGLRASLLKEVQLSIKDSTSLQSARLFQQETEAAEEASQDVEVQYRKFPEDTEIRHLWALSNLMILYARWNEGRQSLAKDAKSVDSVAIFKAVMLDSKKITNELTVQEEPDLWLWANGVQVVSTIYLSEISDAPTASALRNDAVAEIKQTLAALDQARNPDEWAAMETLNGLVLVARAARSATNEKLDPPHVEQDLNDAHTAFQSAQQAYGSPSGEKDWIDVEMRMGDADLLHSMLCGAMGDKITEFLPRAESEYRSAFAKIHKDTDPAHWIEINHDLAEVLSTRAQFTEGAAAMDLWKQAIQEYRVVAEATPKAENPAQWANRQESLALALKNAASVADNPEKGEMLAESVTAYRNELSVFSKASFAQRWAQVQETLGEALAAQASAADRDKAVPIAVQAVTAYQTALEVYTREGYPQRWPGAELNLAIALGALSARTAGNESLHYAQQSLAAFDDLLDAYPSAPQVLSGLGNLYHEHMFDFPKAYEFMSRLESAKPNEGNKLNLAESALTDGKFAECINLTTGLDESKLDAKLVRVRLTLLFACQSAAGQHADAAKTVDALIALAGDLPATGWTTTGDRTYLAAAAEFKNRNSDWVQLFAALQAGDKEKFRTAAQILKEETVH